LRPRRLPGGIPAARAGDVRVAAAGDIACRGCAQASTEKEIRRRRHAAVLTLGDNAYPDGTEGQFARYYDPWWGRFKARTHPSPGNHEYHVPGAAGYFAYFGAAAHESGYYTFALRGWRLISLNSNIAHGPASAQTVWLRHVLHRVSNRCILAYWHSPLRSSGTAHGDDRSVRPFWKALYHARADIVLNGDEHDYERFARTTPSGARTTAGIREFAVGTGGAGLYPFGAKEPGSQERILRHGVLMLRFASRSYSWSFRSVRDVVLDSGSTGCH
jgi:hypothetical protein